MKVLLINGSPNEKKCTYTALSEVARTLEAEGIGTETYWLGKGDIPGCNACSYCGKNGSCSIDDRVNEIGERLDEFDGIVIGSPVYYAGPAGHLKSFLDRLFYAYGGKMRGKVGCCVVSCRRGGASAAFDDLNRYLSITGVTIATSQYWNQVHGSTAEDVLKDEEGLQTMRTLARNMAWLMKCIEAGKDAGIKMPDMEPRIRTDFIKH